MSTALRVLWLIKGLGPGGAEQLLVNQARARSTAEVEFQVAYLVPWKNHLVEPLNDAGVRSHCLDSSRPQDMRWLWRLRTLIEDERIDVVHGHSPFVSSMWRMFGRTIPSSRRPGAVYTEHNEWPRHARETRAINRATIGMEDAVVAVSEGVRSTMPSSIDVEVLHHGINVDAVAALRSERPVVRRELGIDDETTVVGTVANFRREKAHDVLIQAARLVVDRGLNVKFLLVGQGPLESEIQAQIVDDGLVDHVHVLGFRPDAHRIMSGFDIMALASRHEGLPVVLMEAFALGLPVVATSVGGIPEASGDGLAADLVEPGSAVDLADAVAALAIDDDRRSVLGRAAADRAGQFDVHRSVSRLEELYWSVSGRR